MKAMVVFVDVNDTLVRSAGSKRIPIPSAISHVKDLRAGGATLYLWSSGGADYARASAQELGLLECFAGFLPKPHLIIDDQQVHEWRDCKHVHPAQVRNS